MKSTRKIVKFITPFVNLIIDLEISIEKILKNDGFIAIKYQNTFGYNDSRSFEIYSFTMTFFTMEEDHLRSGLPGKTTCLYQGLRWPRHQYGSSNVLPYAEIQASL